MSHYILRIKFIAIIVAIFIPLSAYAAPSISSVNGTVGDGQSIAISGSGFGSGPTIILFEDYSDETIGQPIDTSAPVGTWASVPGSDQTVWGDSLLSNGKGFQVIGECGKGTSVVTFTQTQEIFVSSIAYVPDGYKFPSSSSEETFPDVSALKHFWAMKDSNGYSELSKPDHFAPAWTGAKWYRVASNDPGPSTFDRNGSVGWEWDYPVRFTLWAKGNGASASGTDGMFQGISSLSQVQADYANYKAWFTASHTSYGWNRINFIGYARSGACLSSGHRWVIDDVYVAAGDNAAARVELGNNATYSSCTKLAITTPDSWSSSSITATVRVGLFDVSDTAYVFVVDSNNDASAGHEVTIGQSVGGDTTAPAITIDNADPSNITADSLSVTGNATDAAGTIGAVKFKIGSEPDADNGTACTADDGTFDEASEDFTCDVSGFAEGANTLYVEGDDDSDNWSSGNSITVNLSLPTIGGININL